MDKHLVLKPEPATHLNDVLHWFNNQQALRDWAGPNVDIGDSAAHLQSFILSAQWLSLKFLDADGQCLAFGQVCLREGRYHLGRLAVNPIARGKGVEKLLIGGLLDHAKMHLPRAEESSLWVYRHNQPAWHSYIKIGFVEAAPPDSMAQLPGCVYMTRRMSVDSMDAVEVFISL